MVPPQLSSFVTPRADMELIQTPPGIWIYSGTSQERFANALPLMQRSR
jgi:hypothetical protein